MAAAMVHAASGQQVTEGRPGARAPSGAWQPRNALFGPAPAAVATRALCGPARSPRCTCCGARNFSNPRRASPLRPFDAQPPGAHPLPL